MKLCFGVFAKILKICSKPLAQEKLVANLVRCIDPHSNYIVPEERFNDGDDPEGDKPAISKLVNCKKNFFFSESGIAPTVNLEETVSNLNKRFVLLFEDKGKVKFILSIVRIIQLDDSIDNEENEVFKKAFGVDKMQFLQQDEYDFSDIVGKALLYTTDSEIENIKGADCIKSITDDYINEEFRASLYGYEWNTDKNSLKLFRYKIFALFEEMISKNKIKEFIECVDPTNCVNPSDWFDNCEAFIEDTKNEIWNQYDNRNSVVVEIQKFAQALDNYLNYLALNMRPAYDDDSILVPLCRDENIKWSSKFEETVNNFRCEMVAAYKNIFISVWGNIIN